MSESNDESKKAIDATEIVHDVEEKSFKAEILAQINQYSERPDLLLEVLEKHDPGFIKSLTKEIKNEDKKNNEARYKFGKRQAYTGLIVHSLTAVAIISSLILIILTKQVGFWSILGLSIFYAVSQGGVEGFMRIIKAVASLVQKQNPGD